MGDTIWQLHSLQRKAKPDSHLGTIDVDACYKFTHWLNATRHEKKGRLNIIMSEDRKRSCGGDNMEMHNMDSMRCHCHTYSQKNQFGVYLRDCGKRQEELSRFQVLYYLPSQHFENGEMSLPQVMPLGLLFALKVSNVAWKKKARLWTSLKSGKDYSKNI